MSDRIKISVKLPIMQGDIVYVPGGEPPSELTGGTLIAMYPHLYKRPYVKLCEILEQIPEARVQYLGKAGGMNTPNPERFVVFPDDSTDHRCRTDWFRLLRELANNEQICEPEVRQKEYCNGISAQDDYISPHFRDNNQEDCDNAQVVDDIYNKDSHNTGIVLPPLVPWQIPIKDF